MLHTRGFETFFRKIIFDRNSPQLSLSVQPEPSLFNLNTQTNITPPPVKLLFTYGGLFETCQRTIFAPLLLSVVFLRVLLCGLVGHCVLLYI